MPLPKVNTQEVLNTIAARNYQNVELIVIDGEPCLKANWAQPMVAAFCAEFGVSALESRDFWVIANLHQPYQPKTRFAAAAVIPTGWNDVNARKPPLRLDVEVKGDYTPDKYAYPVAYWNGFEWVSIEWRGTVAIRFWRAKGA